MRFLKHNVRDEFDDLTDVAAFYRVKSVPSFLYLVGGAQVQRIDRGIHDTVLMPLFPCQKADSRARECRQAVACAPAGRAYKAPAACIAEGGVQVIAGVSRCMKQGRCVQMRRVSVPDVRQSAEPTAQLLGWRRMQDVLREVLFRAAPSARH